MHSTRRVRVSPDSADVASSEMGSNTSCQCGPIPGIFALLKSRDAEPGHSTELMWP